MRVSREVGFNQPRKRTQMGRLWRHGESRLRRKSQEGGEHSFIESGNGKVADL